MHIQRPSLVRQSCTQTSTNPQNTIIVQIPENGSAGGPKPERQTAKRPASVQQRPGVAINDAELLHLRDACELAHQEADELLDGHLLAVEFDLIGGVMQLGHHVGALDNCQLRTDCHACEHVSRFF